MSVLQVKQAGTFVPVGGGDSEPAIEPYVRPADWLPLPAVTSSAAGKFVGLVAVFNADNNRVRVSASGAYTVDWGDGAAPVNVANGVSVEKNYAWTDVSSATLTSRGYRQALVTITPQAGQQLVTIGLGVRPTGLASGTTSQWLDITMAGTLVSSLTISGGISHPAAMLERFEYVGTSALATLTPLFTNARQLRSVVGTTWTAGITNFTSFFQFCSALETIPLLVTSAGTNFTSMFQSCSSLKEIPLINTGAATNLSSMFQSCVSLRAVPLLNTAACTTFSSMFNGCVALREIPLFNTGAGQYLSAFLSGCTALRTVPALNTAAALDLSQVFNGCVSLQTIPALNTAAGTNFASMFANCSSLQTIPSLNTAAGTAFTSMFSTCPSLQVGVLAGTRFTISYASCKLSAAQLDAIYTGLANLNTNMLSANAASVETSAADWNVNTVNATVTRTLTGPTGGHGSAELTVAATTTAEAATRLTTRVAVAAGGTYTGMAMWLAAGSMTVRRVRIAWYDAGGVLLSESSGADSAAAGPAQSTVIAVAPATAATASLVLSFVGSAGVSRTWDSMGINPGSNTLWTIPGSTITVTSNPGITADTPSIATAKGWTVTGS